MKKLIIAALLASISATSMAGDLPDAPYNTPYGKTRATVDNTEWYDFKKADKYVNQSSGSIWCSDFDYLEEVAVKQLNNGNTGAAFRIIRNFESGVCEWIDAGSEVEIIALWEDDKKLIAAGEKGFYMFYKKVVK